MATPSRSRLRTAYLVILVQQRKVFRSGDIVTQEEDCALLAYASQALSSAARSEPS